MTEAQLAKLLGRPLTPVESENFALYLDIATEALETLICSPVDSETETRTFDTRKGYSTAFVDIFTEITEVKVDGSVITPSNYSVRQNAKRNGSWFNSLVMPNQFVSNGEIEISANWGFDFSSGDGTDMPNDLQMVLAGLFGLVTKKNKQDTTVKSKRTEDFYISFDTETDLDEAFSSRYNATIQKYSNCDVGNTQHGGIC